MKPLLIIDDDAGDRKNIKRLLRQAKYDGDVEEVGSIREALQLISNRTFCCILVDYHMPGLDGLDGLERLRDTTSSMPIVMVTGQGDEFVASKAFKSGISDYLSKKMLDGDSLIRAIKNSVEKHALELRIEEQNSALRVFSRVLAHDLRSPLTTQYGVAKVVRHMLQREQFDQVPELCDDIVSSCERMTRLIDALVEYNESGLSQDHESVSLNAVVDDVITDLSAKIVSHGAVVTRDELPLVTAQYERLAQLFQNLIENGIKYCDVDTPKVHISSDRGENGALVFSVSDNGMGIPSEECEKVFSPFHRTKSARSYEGTGLGLATCKKIVELHNGRIWCQQRHSRGTEFCFTLGGVGI